VTEPRPSRRIVFHGLSALGVAAVLAGCGGDEAEPRGDDSPSPRTSEPSGSGGTPAESDQPDSKDSRSPTALVLATTDEVPVGGGIVLTDVRVVITQPRRGEFRAFTAVCTHQGQTVGEIDDNVIRCTFHGSEYDAATGEVVGGPAPAALASIPIEVARGDITRA